jgi:outer membrane protein assembly factor BamB
MAGSGGGTLELNDGRLYVVARASGRARRILCLAAGSGERLWSARSDGPLRLQAAEGRLFIRSAALIALDARSGLLLWKSPLGGCGRISFGKGRLYAVDAADRRELIALDSRSGQPAWRRESAASCNGVVADGGIGFISGNDGILHAITLN